MKPHLAVCLLFSAAAAVQAAPPADEAAFHALIAKEYGRLLPQEGCRLTDPPKDSPWVDAAMAYCMKPAAAHTVQRGGQTLKYVLYTGFLYDTDRQEANTAHAATGLAELFVLAGQGGTGRIIMRGRSEVGAWGVPPEKWTFVQMGRQNWGYTAETGYTQMGESSTEQQYLFTDNRNRVVAAAVPTGLDNTGYFGDCRDRKGKDRRYCQSALTDLSAQLRIRRDRVADADVYGLEAAFSGFQGKHKYRGRTYQLEYDGARGRFVAPKAYPLGGMD